MFDMSIEVNWATFYLAIGILIQMTQVSTYSFAYAKASDEHPWFGSNGDRMTPRSRLFCLGIGLVVCVFYEVIVWPYWLVRQNIRAAKSIVKTSKNILKG